MTAITFSPWTETQNNKLVVNDKKRWEAIEWIDIEYIGAVKTPIVKVYTDVFKYWWPTSIMDREGHSVYVCKCSAHFHTQNLVYCEKCGTYPHICGIHDIRRAFFGLIDGCPNLNFYLHTKSLDDIYRTLYGPKVLSKAACHTCGGMYDYGHRITYECSVRRNLFIVVVLNDLLKLSDYEGRAIGLHPHRVLFTTRGCLNEAALRD